MSTVTSSLRYLVLRHTQGPRRTDSRQTDRQTDQWRSQGLGGGVSLPPKSA